ncbi:MAG: ribosomal protein S18-alanine N-acetyltransferase [Thermomicrobiales bacterium]
MTQDDVAEISRVERRCFSNPWPTSAYRRELRNPLQNYYVLLRAYPATDTAAPVPIVHANGASHGRNGDVVRTSRRLHLLPFVRRAAPEPHEPHVAGFAGMWIMYDEAHITTIGIDPVYRGQRLGELLLVVLIEEAITRGATWLTLEVRVSNEVAQRLYRKYGFGVQGTRRRYYSDNGEDAHIMWSRSLKDPAYLDLIDELRVILYDRLGPTLLEASDDDHGQWVDERLSGARS